VQDTINYSYPTNHFVNKNIVENIIFLNENHIQLPLKILTLTFNFWHMAMEKFKHRKLVVPFRSF